MAAAEHGTAVAESPEIRRTADLLGGSRVLHRRLRDYGVDTRAYRHLIVDLPRHLQ